MIKKQIEFVYKGKIEEFDVDYSFREFYLQALDLKITLDKYQFENLRAKMNKMYEDLS